MTNSNCLHGLSCPRCGNDSRLTIEVTTLARVTDDGAEAFGDMHWDANSFAECPQCHHEGTLAAFTAADSLPSTTTTKE